ncbi:hypothetical protein VNI00_009840 [Paramarasmius palmivorus]|uniref:F-box domain-containing protein n=1 Tax=Paramarasmius palmivorus TaxID=297713 RepID=A0AAW0CQV7_9AGAR
MVPMDIDPPETTAPSLVDLPPTTHDALLEGLPPQDLVTYAKVSKKARQVVYDFYRRAYRVERILSRYFSPEEIQRFRILQHAIGFIISGSSALTLFTRSPPYPDSDLDVYVDARWCALLLQFLESHGYAYEPIMTASKRQSEDMYRTLDEAMNRPQEEENGHPGFFGSRSEYSTPGIREVFNFVRDGKKIQVVACTATPVEVILGFHSTVVMCLLCYSHAICLYPRTTFIDHQTLANYRCHENQDAARQKYAERGWEVIQTVDAFRGISQHSDVNYFDRRHLTDSLCWTIPLDPPLGGDFVPSELSLGDFDCMDMHSWAVVYHWNGRTPEMIYDRLNVKELGKSFCLVPAVFVEVQRELGQLLQRVGADRARLKAEFKALVRKYAHPETSPKEPREVCRRVLSDVFKLEPEVFPQRDKLPPVRAGSMVWAYMRTLLEKSELPPKV